MSADLKNVPLFQGLSDGELNEVRCVLREKNFRKGELLFLEGKPCERIFIVQTGRVKVYRMASSGKEQILESLAVGDTCACNPGSANWQCGASAEALTDCKLWVLPRDLYLRLAQKSAGFSHSLNQLFARRLSKFSSLIEEVSLKDVKKRLVKFLLDMHQDTIRIGFTREEIAQRLGTSRETVARYLYQLKRARLIDIRPHEIRLINKAGLAKLLS